MVNYVEFMGPPGAGKSTVHSKLIESAGYFGINDNESLDHVVARHIRSNGPPSLYYAYSILPSFIRSPISDELINYRFRYNAFKRLIEENPDYLSVIEDGLSEIDYSKDDAFIRMVETAGRYQLSKENVKSNEVLCLDMGFIMLLCILQRYSDDNFSNKLLDNYYHNVPRPEAVIYVDAPTEECLSRQRRRGSLAQDKVWVSDQTNAQKRFEGICDTIAGCLMERGVEVIKIDNTGNVDDSVHEVQRKMPK